MPKNTTAQHARVATKPTTEDLQTTAKTLSSLINNPSVPLEARTALADAINELSPSVDFNSPDFIYLCLVGLSRKGGAR